MARAADVEAADGGDEPSHAFLETSKEQPHRCACLGWVALPLVLTLSMAIWLIPLERFQVVNHYSSTSKLPASMQHQEQATYPPPPPFTSPTGNTFPDNASQSETPKDSTAEGGTENHEDAGTENQEGAGTESQEPSGTENQEDAGTENQEDAGTEDQKDPGTGSEEDSGTGSEENAETSNQENAETENRGDAGAENGEDAGTESEEDSGTEGEKDAGTKSEEDSGTGSEEDPETDAENAETVEQGDGETENDEDPGTKSEEDEETANEGDSETEEGNGETEDSKNLGPEIAPTPASVSVYEGVKWKHGILPANGLNIHYYETVEDPNVKKKKLLFLHGIATSAAVLIPLFNNFAPDYHIMLPDARGHGDSQPIPAKSFTMMKLITDALQILKIFRNGENESIYLSGHSMGASTAARLAQFFPNQIKAALLEEPPWSHMFNEPLGLQNRQIPPFFARSRALKKLPNETFSNLNSASALSPPAWTHLQALRAFDADGIEPTYWEADNLITAAAGPIKVPVLLQTGGENSLCNAEVARKALALWTDGKLQIFQGTSKTGVHAFHFSHKAEWLETTQAWLKEHW